MKHYLNQNSKYKGKKEMLKVLLREYYGEIFKFSLPVVKTCPQAKACKEFCYGLKGHYVTFKETVDKAHKNNLEFTKSKLFCHSMVTEIHKRKIKIIRLHDTGDFYSQEYLKRWALIASFCDDTFFYAYTKSFHLNFDNFLSLPNTKIIQSFGGKLDNRIDKRKSHCIIFNCKEHLESDNYIDCSNSDFLAIKSKRIGLVLH